MYIASSLDQLNYNRSKYKCSQPEHSTSQIPMEKNLELNLFVLWERENISGVADLAWSWLSYPTLIYGMTLNSVLYSVFRTGWLSVRI